MVTCGEDGCWFHAQGWLLPRHHPAFKVEVVDTTGCGDVFHGAYALGASARLGSLHPGKQGDLILMEGKDYREIFYRFGANLVTTVIKKGKVVS